MSVPVLRPMTVGDILDQAFSLYRKNFVTLLGIVALIHAPLLVLQIVGNLLYYPQTGQQFGRFGTLPQTQTTAALGGFGIIALTVVVAIIAQVFEIGALSVVVSERLLGNTVTLRQAYRRTLSRWKPLVAMLLITGGAGIGLLLLLAIPAGILTVLLGGVVLGASSNSLTSLVTALIVCLTCLGLPLIFIAYYGVSVRLLFAPQTIVLENLGALDALRRSWRLVQGSFWRVLGITFAVGLLLTVLQFVPAIIVGIVANLLPFPALGIILNTTAQTVGGILALPIQFAVFTLLYYDLRIRKEGFDLQIMAQQLVPALSGLADNSGEIAAA